MRIRTGGRVVLSLALAGAAASLVVPRSSASVAAAEIVRDLAAAPPQSVGVDPDRVKRIGQLAKQFVDGNRLSGAVTMLNRHGKVVDVTVHGKKDIRKPDPIQVDSIFRIYSMTKPITGVAMMMLFERANGG